MDTYITDNLGYYTDRKRKLYSILTPNTPFLFTKVPRVTGWNRNSRLQVVQDTDTHLPQSSLSHDQPGLLKPLTVFTQEPFRFDETDHETMKSSDWVRFMDPAQDFTATGADTPTVFPFYNKTLCPGMDASFTSAALPHSDQTTPYGFQLAAAITAANLFSGDNSSFIQLPQVSVDNTYARANSLHNILFQGIRVLNSAHYEQAVHDSVLGTINRIRTLGDKISVRPPTESRQHRLYIKEGLNILDVREDQISHIAIFYLMCVIPYVGPQGSARADYEVFVTKANHLFAEHQKRYCSNEGKHLEIVKGQRDPRADAMEEAVGRMNIGGSAFQMGRVQGRGLTNKFDKVDEKHYDAVATQMREAIEDGDMQRAANLQEELGNVRQGKDIDREQRVFEATQGILEADRRSGGKLLNMTMWERILFHTGKVVGKLEKWIPSAPGKLYEKLVRLKNRYGLLNLLAKLALAGFVTAAFTAAAVENLGGVQSIMEFFIMLAAKLYTGVQYAPAAIEMGFHGLKGGFSGAFQLLGAGSRVLVHGFTSSTGVNLMLNAGVALMGVLTSTLATVVSGAKGLKSRLAVGSIAGIGAMLVTTYFFTSLIDALVPAVQPTMWQWFLSKFGL